MSLTSLIVQRAIATIREVEEALARQVLYGGDLVTNLLEVSRVAEPALLPLVAESFGLPSAPSGALPPPSEDAKRMVAAEVATSRGLAPLWVERGTLVVAVAEPLGKDVEQELAFALAVPIAQRIAPLVRIKEALARDYGVALDRRTERVLARLRGDKGAMGSIPPPRVEPEVAPPPRPPSAAPPPMRPASEAPRREGMPRTLVRADAGQAAGAASAMSAMSAAPPSRGFRRRRGPLTAELARTELEDVDQRDTIFDLVFEFARQYFDFTALFVVHGDVAEGRDAFGDGAPREKIVRVGVPLDLPGMLADARIKKTVHRARPAADGIDPVLFADLGRSGKSECVVLPIVVRTRVVALVLGDGGDAGVDEASLEEVKGVVAAAVAAFERIIVRRKLKGTAPPPSAVAAIRAASPSAPPPLPQISEPPPRTEISARPAAEELATPIRDLLAEPVSRWAPETRREPLPAIVNAPEPSDRPLDGRPLSERPPPANLLPVRRPSGPPIPREEPDGLADARSRAGAARTKSGSLRRAEAPPLEFGARPQAPSMTFGQDDVERSLLAQIHGTEIAGAPATRASSIAEPIGPSSEAEPPPSPKAVSPPPPLLGARAASSTVVSPGMLPMFPARTDDTSAPASPVGMEGLIDEDKTPIAPPPEMDEAHEAHVAHHAREAQARREPFAPTRSAPYAYVPSPATPAPPDAHAPSSAGASEEDDVVDVDAAGLEVTRLPSSASMTAASPSSPPPSVPPSAPDTTRQPMPISEQQVSVGAHRPPSSRTDASRVLPSVIVDVASEYVAFVDRVLSGTDDDAESELLRAGGYAMPAIMARFPGPITIESDRLDEGTLPRVGECGPVLRLVASQRRTALPFVLAHVEDEDETRRFWATYLLTELVYADAIQPALNRVFDENARVRRAARAATRALAELHGAAIVERLEAVVRDAALPTARRVMAIDAIGETREPLGVPALLPLLGDPAPDIVSAARRSLVAIARQDFAIDTAKWKSWWSANKDRHRIEWLIDALMHDQASVRAAAGEELKTTTKEIVGYYEDLPRRERASAQARYRDWWATTGRVRFGRAR